MSKRTIRCFSRTLGLIVAVLVMGAGAALAQVHVTGVNIQKSCPFFVNQGEAYTCTFSLQNNDVDHGVINMHVFESHPPVSCGFNQMTACAGEVEVTCTGGPTVNSLAKKNTAGDTCTGSLPEFTAPITCSTDDFQDTDRIRSTGNDEGVPALSATGSTDNGPIVRGLICPADTNECTADICTVGVGCEHPNLDDSTACTDSDGNACTTAGCEAGLCVQAHNTTVCTPDNNECTSDPVCNPATGLCDHPPLDDSTACTDSDGNLCTTAGCEAGVCVQAHNTTVCTPDTNECTSDPACDPLTGLCTHPNLDDSTACGDTDNQSCTTAGCEAGVCVQTHIEDCNNEEVCRTPGFWGTHGGIEKGGPNLTQAVLNQTGPIDICGHTISTTDLSNTSAIEAICSSPKGDSTLQLARQLTAAALNCGVTNSTSCGTPGSNGETVGNVCAGVSIETTFNDCNALCADPTASQADITACIDAIDCFNNGGAGLVNGVCDGDTGCHDRNGAGCISLTNPGPASSPKKCNDARKDDCSIFCSVACTNLVACTD